MSVYYASCNDLSYRIHDLEKQISEREHKMCANEAKIFYEDLISVHETLVEHENQLKTTCDGYTSTDYFAKDMRKTHLMTTNLKIKLTKILSSFESKSSTEARVNLDLLFQKRESLMKRISSLESTEDLCSEKAEVMSNHLNLLYESFDSNQTEIESQVRGGVLDSEMEISEQVQNKVIELQAKFKKIFAPIELSSSSIQSEALQSEQIKLSELESSLRSIELKLSNLTDLLESRSSRDETESNINDVYTHLEDNSEISKDIQNKIISLQTTLNESIVVNKNHEKNALNKLDKILEFNGRFEQDNKTKTLASLLKSESNLRAIELKLSELVTSCKELPQLRSDGYETRKNVIKIVNSLNDNLSISRDTQTQMRNFLVTDNNRTAILNDIRTKVKQSASLQNLTHSLESLMPPPLFSNPSNTQPYRIRSSSVSSHRKN
ncbi:uncharacterized protein LOC135843794 [Planococcus citri]|uniref:uncharacterized protein LOC135843794 n=1 Tax=Planococcus citri TaxID=170843 RepID=UPI0031F76D01